MWAWLSALGILFVDQVTKHWVLAHYALGERTALLDFLNITLVYNRGAAFGLFSGMGEWGRFLFLALALVVSFFLVIWWWRTPASFWLRRGAIVLVVAGALGNAIDRAIYGYVIDFIDFHFWGWHYPAFNVADSAITIGAIGLFWSLWRQPRV